MDLILYCDGASRGNPGPASYGVLACLSDDTEIGHGGSFLGSATNNTAEWQGAIGSLQFAHETTQSHPELGIERIVLRMDSLLVVKQLTGQWKIKEPRLRVLYDQARAIVKQLRVPIKMEWIPREQNSAADKIANQCLDSRTTDGPRFSLTRSHPPPNSPPSPTQKTSGKKRVQCSLDEETYNAFQEAARKVGTTTSTILLAAIKDYLQK